MKFIVWIRERYRDHLTMKPAIVVADREEAEKFEKTRFFCRISNYKLVRVETKKQVLYFMWMFPRDHWQVEKAIKEVVVSFEARTEFPPEELFYTLCKEAWLFRGLMGRDLKRYFEEREL